MKNVIRKISLEDLKTRFNCKQQYISDDGMIVTPGNIPNIWGYIPIDCTFNSEIECPFNEIVERILVTRGIDKDSKPEKIVKTNKVLRYKDIIKWKNWIEGYSKTSTYYKLCKRLTNLKWVEIKGDFFQDNYSFNYNKAIQSYQTLPKTDDNSFQIGDIIEVNKEANIINEIFRVEGSNKRFELILYNFINDYMKGEANFIPSIPFIDLPLFINETYDNIGLLHSHAKEWEPKKTYHVGDIVLYNNETYILTSGDGYVLTEISGGFYNILYNIYSSNKETTTSIYYHFIEGTPSSEEENINEVVYHEGRRNIYYEMDGDTPIFSYPTITHKAIYNPKIDEYTFNLDMWSKHEQFDTLYDDTGVPLTSGEASAMLFKDYTHLSTAESRLSSMRRYKKTIDDDGNALSFIINESGSTDTELIFKLGVANKYLSSDDVIHADIITEINIANNIGSESIKLKYFDGKINITKQVGLLIGKPINDVIVLNADIENLELKYNPELDEFSYQWVEIEKLETPEEGVDYYGGLPEANIDNFGDILYISSITNDVLYYSKYESKKKEIFVSYEGVTSNNIPIKPSYVSQNWGSYFSSEGTISFTYIKGAIIDNSNKLKENTGIVYNEEYPYEIITYGVNYVSSEEIEKIHEHKYSLYEYDLKEGDVVLGEITEDLTYKNVGNIYVKKGSNDEVTYLRVLSDYTAFNIMYDKGQVIENDVEKNEKNNILSYITFNAGQTIEDAFEKDYVFKNENFIGLEEVIKDINIDIERGTSAAFERLHILSEVKSFSDLENYRNNYFKL